MQNLCTETIRQAFLNCQVIVKTRGLRLTIKGVLLGIDKSKHDQGLGTVILQNDDGVLLIRGNRVASIAVLETKKCV